MALGRDAESPALVVCVEGGGSGDRLLPTEGGCWREGGRKRGGFLAQGGGEEAGRPTPVLSIASPSLQASYINLKHLFMAWVHLSAFYHAHPNLFPSSTCFSLGSSVRRPQGCGHLC